MARSLPLQARGPEERPLPAPERFLATRLHGEASFRRDVREFVRPDFPRIAARGFLSAFIDRTTHPPRSSDKGLHRTCRGPQLARERGTLASFRAAYSSRA